MKKPPPALKIVCWLAGITLVIAAGWLFVLTRDIPPIDDSDLDVPLKQADPDQNPYPEFRDIEISDEDSEAIGALSRARTSGEAIDHSELSGLLGKFSSELNRFDRYAVMTDWVQDQDYRIDIEAPHLTNWMTIAKLRRLEIHRHIDKGETEAALAKSLGLIRFGMRLQEAQGPLIQAMVGSTISAFGQVELVDLIDRGDLNAGELDRLAEDLNAIHFDPEAFADTLRVEYQIFKAVIDDLASGKLSPASWGTGMNVNPFVFKRNQTRALFAESYRQMIEEVPLVRKDAPRSSTELVEGIAKQNRVMMFVSGNAVGKILFTVGMPAVDGMLDNLAAQRAKHDLLRVRVALERYRLARGGWPADLDALVPEFLDAIPADPMDGAPLRYDRDKGVIYSIGRNLRDDGGVAQKKPGQLRDREEIIITLEPEAESP